MELGLLGDINLSDWSLFPPPSFLSSHYWRVWQKPSKEKAQWGSMCSTFPGRHKQNPMTFSLGSINMIQKPHDVSFCCLWMKYTLINELFFVSKPCYILSTPGVNYQRETCHWKLSGIWYANTECWWQTKCLFTLRTSHRCRQNQTKLSEGSFAI